MNWMQWARVATIGGIMLAAGCQPKAPPPQGPVYLPPVPVSPDARVTIHRLAPDAVVGTVVAVLPDAGLAAVGDVPVSQFKVGDVVTFMGGEPGPATVGTVVAIVNDRLQVRYETPLSGGRPPAVGDLAVRFKQQQK